MRVILRMSAWTQCVRYKTTKGPLCQLCQPPAHQSNRDRSNEKRRQELLADPNIIRKLLLRYWGMVHVVFHTLKLMLRQIKGSRSWRCRCSHGKVADKFVCRSVRNLCPVTICSFGFQFFPFTHFTSNHSTPTPTRMPHALWRTLASQLCRTSNTPRTGKMKLTTQGKRIFPSNIVPFPSNIVPFPSTGKGRLLHIPKRATESCSHASNMASAQMALCQARVPDLRFATWWFVGFLLSQGEKGALNPGVAGVLLRTLFDTFCDAHLPNCPVAKTSRAQHANTRHSEHPRNQH